LEYENVQVASKASNVLVKW